MLLLQVVGSQFIPITGVCNPRRIPRGSPFFSTVGNLLVQLEEDTPFNDYNYKMTYTDSSTGTAAYGQAICNVSDIPQRATLYTPFIVPRAICTACLTNLGNSIWNFCNNAVAAQVESGDRCSILYAIIQSSTP